MKQNEIDNIRGAIILCQMRLRNLRPHIENSASLSEIYNRVLIEKAVLRKNFTTKQDSLVKKIFNKFFAKKEKLICDYFK